MPQQCRAPGSLGVEPFQLVEMGMHVIEYPIGPSAEYVGISRVIDAKPTDRHAVDHIGARGIFVAPRYIVPGARCEDINSGVLRQVLRHIAGVQFGPTVDVGAIALHHDSELHCADGSGSSPESASSDPVSARPSESLSGPSV